jgi:mannose-6-phosphate isomerase-like protein (cupin superfamily)
MTIPVGGEFGDGVHENTDQILTFVSGTGDAARVGHTHPFEDGDRCTVPAGTMHNFRNTPGEKNLVLYTIYSPLEHAPDAVHATKEAADAAVAASHLADGTRRHQAQVLSERYRAWLSEHPKISV